MKPGTLPPSRLTWHLAAAGTSLALVFVAVPFNARLFLAINGWNHPLADPVALAVTMLGDGLFLSMFLLAAARRSPSRSLAGLAAIVAAGLAAQILKSGADVPRPGAVLEGVHLIGPALLMRSFPSGHTASAFAVAGVLGLAARSITGAALPVAVAVAVAWSRIYVGAHYPADVAMGAFLGLTAAGFATAAVGGIREELDAWGERNRGTLSRGTAIVFSAAAVYLLAAHPEMPAQARIPVALASAAMLPAFFGGYSRISRR